MNEVFQPVAATAIPCTSVEELRSQLRAAEQNVARIREALQTAEWLREFEGGKA